MSDSITAVENVTFRVLHTSKVRTYKYLRTAAESSNPVSGTDFRCSLSWFAALEHAHTRWPNGSHYWPDTFETVKKCCVYRSKMQKRNSGETTDGSRRHCCGSDVCHLWSGDDEWKKRKNSKYWKKSDGRQTTTDQTAHRYRTTAEVCVALSGTANCRRTIHGRRPLDSGSTCRTQTFRPDDRKEENGVLCMAV